jgi:hypothetical protein
LETLALLVLQQIDFYCATSPASTVAKTRSIFA